MQLMESISDMIHVRKDLITPSVYYLFIRLTALHVCAVNEAEWAVHYTM